MSTKKIFSSRSLAVALLTLTCTATFSIFACVVLMELSWLSAIVAMPLALIYGIAYGKLLYNQFQILTVFQTPAETKDASKASDIDESQSKKGRKPAETKHPSMKGSFAFLFARNPCKDPNCVENHLENSSIPLKDDTATPSVTLQEKLHRVAWHASAAFSFFYMTCVCMVVSPWPIWATLMAIAIPCIFGVWHYRKANQKAIVSKSRIQSSRNQQGFFDKLDQHSSLCWLLLHALFESIVPIAGVRVLFMQHKQYFSAFIGVSLVGLASGILKITGELSVIYPWLHAHNTKSSYQKPFSNFKMLGALALCVLSALGLGYELYAHAFYCFISLSMAPLAATLTAASLSIITASLWTWLLFTSTQSGVCSHHSSEPRSGIQAILWKGINLTAALTNGVIAIIELSEIIPAMGVLGYLPGAGVMITAAVIAFLAAMLLDGVFLNGSTNNDPTIGVIKRFVLSFAFKANAGPSQQTSIRGTVKPVSALDASPTQPTEQTSVAPPALLLHAKGPESTSDALARTKSPHLSASEKAPQAPDSAIKITRPRMRFRSPQPLFTGEGLQASNLTCQECES